MKATTNTNLEQSVQIQSFNVFSVVIVEHMLFHVISRLELIFMISEIILAELVYVLLHK
jgi:hypothetical protein